MTEIETLIAVTGTLGGTLGGILLGYVLDQRKEASRLGRETALTTLPIRQAALKDLYNDIVVLGLAIAKFSGYLEYDPENDPKEVAKASDKFDESFLKALIWMSELNAGKLDKARSDFHRATIRIIDGDKLSQEESDNVSNALGTASAAIGDELHTRVLEGQLREMFSKLAGGKPKS